jgi:DNA recombination protein RmuC
MSEVLWIAAGLILGGGVAWAFAVARGRAEVAASRGGAEELRRQLEATRTDLGKTHEDLRAAAAERAAAEARATAAQGNLEEQRALLEDAKGKLADAFKALAADTLKSSNEGFLTLARERFATLQQEAVWDLEARKTAIETLVQPLRQALEEYQKEARALEEKRLREISGVGQQVQAVATATALLQRETGNLVNALRAPQVRGRWGEITLRRTAELAGMARHCDFVEQESVATDGGARLRPDMIVRLPSRREIVVDSKVALNAYLEALEAPTPEEREAALARHTQQVRLHARQLASKEYWGQFKNAPEFVVMFIPGEAFLAAAAERDPNLIEEALRQNVLLATPTTFIGLLLSVAYGWRQEQIAENAQHISDLGRQLHERMATLAEHLGRVGKALKGAVDAYDNAVGSVESRVLPAARRFAELGAGSGKEIPPLNPIAQVPRSLAAFPDDEPTA